MNIRTFLALAILAIFSGELSASQSTCAGCATATPTITQGIGTNKSVTIAMATVSPITAGECNPTTCMATDSCNYMYTVTIAGAGSGWQKAFGTKTAPIGTFGVGNFRYGPYENATNGTFPMNADAACGYRVDHVHELSNSTLLLGATIKMTCTACATQITPP